MVARYNFDEYTAGSFAHYCNTFILVSLSDINGDFSFLMRRIRCAATFRHNSGRAFEAAFSQHRLRVLRAPNSGHAIAMLYRKAHTVSNHVRAPQRAPRIIAALRTPPNLQSSDVYGLLSPCARTPSVLLNSPIRSFISLRGCWRRVWRGTCSAIT